MTQSEFLAWCEFYRLFPFDDLHRFHRPAALIASQGIEKQQQAIDDRINWLQPDPRSAEMGDADMNTLRAFGFRTKAH